MSIPLIKPYINLTVRQRVMDVLDSGHLTEGPVTAALEECFARYLNVPHCLAVTSCTVGMELALRCLGIGPGDEVIVPDYTYPATADVVAIVGATVILVDVDPTTMLIDYRRLEDAITPRTRAIIPVSLFGNPLDYTILNQLKDRYGVYIIEDAACALGSEYNGVKVGGLADISVFSLHPRKFITSGEGGMIVTGNRLWSDWMHSYKKFGMDYEGQRASIIFSRVGTNYKLSDVLAAIALGQMEIVDDLLNRREKLARSYIEQLKDFAAFSLPATTPGGRHSYQTFSVMTSERDRLLVNLRRQGIEVQIGTYSLHQHPAFQPSEWCRWNGDLSGSTKAFQSCLALPLFHEMSEAEMTTVVTALKAELDG